MEGTCEKPEKYQNQYSLQFGRYGVKVGKRERNANVKNTKYLSECLLTGKWMKFIGLITYKLSQIHTSIKSFSLMYWELLMKREAAGPNPGLS